MQVSTRALPMTRNTSLAEFIRSNIAPIVADWESFAQTLTPAADTMTHIQLRDHIKEILFFIAEDIESSQTNKEQKDKSQGSADSASPYTIGAIHGGLRFGEGFDIIQMASEYRALRASIIKLWRKTKKSVTGAELDDLTRFNESIDQLLAESLRRFMEKLDHSRDLILGILGHDIRSPLGAIKMSAELIPLTGVLNEKQGRLASQIVGSSVRINQIVGDLLDLTRARVGTELPVHKAFMDISIVATQLVTEMRAQHPERRIVLETTGSTEGEWDSIRLGQIFSNLIGNAVQYSPAGSTIHVRVKGDAQNVVFSVHNEGTPIPAEVLGTIFDFLIRAKETDTAQNMESSMHLGLGLYIVKQIVVSHGGEVDVISSENRGTIFTVTLPRSTVRL